MKTPHKHAAVIKAWADGETIEHRPKDGSGQWYISYSTPKWALDWEYRVKPKGMKYRLCICKTHTGQHYVCAFTEGFGQSVQVWDRSPTFVKWIDTEWQEVEV